MTSSTSQPSTINVDNLPVYFGSLCVSSSETVYNTGQRYTVYTFSKSRSVTIAQSL